MIATAGGTRWTGIASPNRNSSTISASTAIAITA